MSTQDALTFIDRIIKNFPPHNWTEDRQKEWVGSVVKELGQMPREALARAADEIVRTRKVARTPVVAELVEACKEAEYWVKREKGEGQLPIDQQEVLRFAVWSDERKRLADDLIRTPQGKTAAKEGWIRGLHDFCREHGRAPNEYEVRTIKADAEAFQTAYEKALRGGWPQAAALADLGGKMVRRGEELADMVLHGVVR